MNDALKMERNDRNDHNSFTWSDLSDRNHEKLVREMNRVVQISDTIAAATNSEVDEIMSFSNVVILAMVAVSLVFLTYIACRLISSISVPAKKLASAMHDLSDGKGDLTVSLKVDRMDELGQIVGYFNKFIRIIHAIVEEVKNAADDLAVSIIQMSSATANIADNIREQAASAEHVSVSV